MDAEPSHPVHSFAKSEDEQYQISLNRFKDRCYIDIRLWFQGSDTASWRPTKKGICIPVERFPEFLEGVEALQRRLATMRSAEASEAGRAVQ
jgi:nitrous oxidase accessory protein NosD